jgi:hypothetical protein
MSTKAIPTTTAKTMDQFCDQPAGSFKTFIKEKEAFLQSLEHERKERVRACRKAARELSWAA